MPLPDVGKDFLYYEVLLHFVSSFGDGRGPHVGSSRDFVRVDLLEDLIRPQQQRRWDREAERPCSPQIDEERVLRRLGHGEVGRFGTLQDLVDVGHRLPDDLDEIGAETHQSPERDGVSERTARWNSIREGQLGDALTVSRGERSRDHQDGLCIAPDLVEGVGQLARIADPDGLDLNAKRDRRSLSGEAQKIDLETVEKVLVNKLVNALQPKDLRQLHVDVLNEKLDLRGFDRIKRTKKGNEWIIEREKSGP